MTMPEVRWRGNKPPLCACGCGTEVRKDQRGWWRKYASRACATRARGRNVKEQRLAWGYVNEDRMIEAGRWD